MCVHVDSSLTPPLFPQISTCYIDGPIPDFTHVHLRFWERNIGMITEIAAHQIFPVYRFLTPQLLSLLGHKLVETKKTDNAHRDIPIHNFQQFL